MTEHPHETKQTTHTKYVTSTITFIEMYLNTSKRSFCACAPLTAVTSAVQLVVIIVQFSRVSRRIDHYNCEMTQILATCMLR